MSSFSCLNAARNCQNFRSAVMASKGAREEDSEVFPACLSVLSVAMELLTDTIQVCGGLTVLNILALNGVLALSLLLSDVLTGELVIDGLDRPLNPLSSALPAFFAWCEGVSLLRCVAEEGLDVVLGWV